MKLLNCFVFLFLLCWAGPLQAQSPLPQLQRTLIKATAPTQTVLRSQLSNANLQRRLSLLFSKPKTLPQPKQLRLPAQPKPISFLVQTGPKSDKTASAFALEVNGTLVGVTAGHVMHNILHYHEPYMSFVAEDGTKIEFPISQWRSTNKNGSDVAIFKIPEEARAHVQALKMGNDALVPFQTASIAGFANNVPLWLPNEEILFLGPHRILLRNTSQHGLDGMCGSPVMVNGKVVGLYVGYFSKNQTISDAWAAPIRNLFDQSLPDLHQVAPIGHIRPLVEDLNDEGSLLFFGTTMKVFDFPVATLHPKDQLFSITLMRNGFAKETIHPGPLTDPEHLENFFKLQDNDVLRVEVLPDGYTFSRGKSTFYDINVSTGEVSSFVR